VSNLRVLARLERVDLALQALNISNMHAISKCQFGLLTGTKFLLTRSTWQKFLSTGPHPVYRLKQYRYKTQATLSC
jgi:hypothetical protein